MIQITEPNREENTGGRELFKLSSPLKTVYHYIPFIKTQFNIIYAAYFHFYCKPSHLENKDKYFKTLFQSESNTAFLDSKLHIAI